jgi:type II secretory pathway pseudopilin PulG
MTRRGEQSATEEGFMLLGLIVAIAIILMVLGAAATKVAFTLHREREVESARRADQYVRAIRKFYIKNQHYPGSLEQLENTNRIRYLRQRYVDPLTGKADYRLILVGKNKTTVKGFFGEPLEGIAAAGLGSAAGLQSPGMGAAFGGAAQTNGIGGSGYGIAAAGTAPGGVTTSGTNSGTTGPGDASGSSQSFGSSLGSALGASGQLGGGPFMGVGSSATGDAILVVNEQSAYDTWEFLYDPRIEKLKAAAMLKGGMGSAGTGSLGTGANGFGSSTPGNGSQSPSGGGTTAPQP